VLVVKLNLIVSVARGAWPTESEINVESPGVFFLGGSEVVGKCNATSVLGFSNN